MTDNTFTGGLAHLADSMKLASQHLVETRKHVADDHGLVGSLHRLEAVMRDAAHQIHDVIAAMPRELRDRLDAIEMSN